MQFWNPSRKLANIIENLDKAAALTDRQARANAAAAIYEETEQSVDTLLRKQTRRFFVSMGVGFAALALAQAFIAVGGIVAAGCVVGFGSLAWATSTCIQSNKLKEDRSVLQENALRLADGAMPQFPAENQTPDALRRMQRLKAIFGYAAGDADFKDLRDRVMPRPKAPRR